MKSKNNNGTSSPAPIKVGAGGGITGGINRGGGWGSGNGQGQVNRNLMGGVSPRGGDSSSPYRKIGGKNPSSNGLAGASPQRENNKLSMITMSGGAGDSARSKGGSKVLPYQGKASSYELAGGGGNSRMNLKGSELSKGANSGGMHQDEQPSRDNIQGPGGAGAGSSAVDSRNKDQFLRWKTVRDEKKRAKGGKIIEDDEGLLGNNNLSGRQSTGGGSSASRALRSLSIGNKTRKCCKRTFELLICLDFCKREKPPILAQQLDLYDDQYSSGESEDDIRENYRKMDDEQKFERIAELWSVTLAKARGAVHVINTFGDLNRVIYYHGSTKKLETLEMQESVKPLPCILMPDSKVIAFWNIVMMLLLLYTATYIPFKTAFIEDSSSLVSTIEFSIDSLFFVDLVVNFVSAYETSDRNIEFRFSRIAFSYISTWFLLDLVSCIPFQYLDFSSTDTADVLPNVAASSQDMLQNLQYNNNYYDGGVGRYLGSGVTTVIPNVNRGMRILQMITNGYNDYERIPSTNFMYTASSNSTDGRGGLDTPTDNTNGGANPNSPNLSKLVRLARLPRLYKLLRILRLFKMVRLLKYNRNIKRLLDRMKMNPGYVRMLTMILTIIFLVHLVSCFYYMVVSFNDFGPDCWVAAHGLLDEDNFTQYLSAVYWTFQTLTTVGYGDMQGTTTPERVFCTCWILIGVAYYSFAIGSLQSIISNVDSNSHGLGQKLNTLQSLAKNSKLPDNVTNKIKKFLENNSSELNTIAEEQDLFNQLPVSIRAEIVQKAYQAVIERFKFFQQQKDPDFLWVFLTSLKPMTVYSRHILYNQGDHPEEVFFIMRGQVKLCYDVSEGEGNPKYIPFNQYGEGSYFGEMEMMMSYYKHFGRDGTAMVDCECQLFVIESHEFKRTLRHFPDVKKHMKSNAEKRHLHHKEAVEDAKKRVKERNIKGLKVELFQEHSPSLNVFNPSGTPSKYAYKEGGSAKQIMTNSINVFSWSPLVKKPNFQVVAEQKPEGGVEDPLMHIRKMSKQEKAHLELAGAKRAMEKLDLIEQSREMKKKGPMAVSLSKDSMTEEDSAESSLDNSADPHAGYGASAFEKQQQKRKSQYVRHSTYQFGQGIDGQRAIDSENRKKTFRENDDAIDENIDEEDSSNLGSRAASASVGIKGQRRSLSAKKSGNSSFRMGGMRTPPDRKKSQDVVEKSEKYHTPPPPLQMYQKQATKSTKIFQKQKTILAAIAEQVKEDPSVDDSGLQTSTDQEVEDNEKAKAKHPPGKPSTLKNEEGESSKTKHNDTKQSGINDSRMNSIHSSNSQQHHSNQETLRRVATLTTPSMGLSDVKKLISQANSIEKHKDDPSHSHSIQAKRNVVGGSGNNSGGGTGSGTGTTTPQVLDVIAEETGENNQSPMRPEKQHSAQKSGQGKLTGDKFPSPIPSQTPPILSKQHSVNKAHANQTSAIQSQKHFDGFKHIGTSNTEKINQLSSAKFGSAVRLGSSGTQLQSAQPSQEAMSSTNSVGGKKNRHAMSNANNNYQLAVVDKEKQVRFLSDAQEALAFNAYRIDGLKQEVDEELKENKINQGKSHEMINDVHNKYSTMEGLLSDIIDFL